MTIAHTVSAKSKCSRRQVGAVIVSSDNRRLVSVGYNGAPRGFPEEEGQTCKAFCPRASENVVRASYDSCVSVHSEINALLSGDNHLYEGAKVYVTSSVCWDCAKVIANSGIKYVVMCVSEEDAHRNPEKTISFLEQCGLDVKIIETVDAWIS